MPLSIRFRALAFALAITVAGCAAPPNADVDAAKASLDKAAAASDGKYAPDSLKAAQDAQAALDAELKTQEGKWVKSYDRTKELAATARTASEKAAADATAAKERADAVAARATAAAAARAKARQSAVRIEGRTRPPTKIKDVKPVYPAIARSARVAGVVTIEATIGQDGKVVDAQVVKSVPMLDQAALDAVQQWEYTPPLVNGKPTSVIVTVTINFTL